VADVGLAHDRLEVGDLDAALGGLLLGSGAGVRGDHAGAGVVDQRGDPEPGGAEADLADDGLVQALADLATGGDRRAEAHDRGAVDVVVHDGLGKTLDQPPLDLEAGRRGDVLEVDAAEARGDPHDGVDELVDVLGVDQDRDGADPDELGVEERLALHHRHGGERPDVAEAEHAGAVGDDGHAAPDHGEAGGQLRELGDGQRDAGDARRVDVADVLVGADLAPRDDVELAAVMRDEGAIVEPAHAHAVEVLQGDGELLGVRLVAQLDGDLAQRLVAGDRDRRHVADEAAVLGDPRGDLGQLAGSVRDAQAVGAVHGHVP
jgi:hypothetical protein